MATVYSNKEKLEIIKKQKEKEQAEEIKTRPLNPDDLSIIGSIRKWVVSYNVGFFYLGGNNPLVKLGLFPMLRHVTSSNGIAVLVKKVAQQKSSKSSGSKGDEKTSVNRITKNSNVLDFKSNMHNYEDGVYLVGRIDEIKKEDNMLRTFESLKVTYYDAFGEEGKSEDLINPEVPNEFVLFLLNSPTCLSDLNGTRDWLDVFDYVFKSMIFDLEICRPRLMLLTDFELSYDQEEKIRDDLDKYNFMTFISSDDGLPFRIHEWKPESRFSNLKSMMDSFLDYFRTFHNIRFDPSNKIEGRSPVKEVELKEDQFEGAEITKQQYLESFLQNLYDFDGGEQKGHTYNLGKEGNIVFRLGEQKANTQSFVTDKSNVIENDKDENKDEKDAEKENVDVSAEPTKKRRQLK